MSLRHELSATIARAEKAEAQVRHLQEQNARLREALRTADMALGYITEDAVNRLTSDTPMLLMDVRKLDGVVAIVRQALEPTTTTQEEP